MSDPNKEKKFGVCKCLCHTSEVAKKHLMPCCQTCQKCNKRIRWELAKRHVATCTG